MPSMHVQPLSQLLYPASVTNFNDRTFNGCRNLSAVLFLGSSCPSLGQNTFADVSNDFGFYVKPSALSALQGIAYVSDKVRIVSLINRAVSTPPSHVLLLSISVQLLV